jgi:hypothetical protein
MEQRGEKEMITFDELKKIVTEQDVYFWYDNDYWEINRYPEGIELTEEEEENFVIVHSDEVDFSTFPIHQLYGGNQYGNGLLVLLANTPNHRVKGVRVA